MRDLETTRTVAVAILAPAGVIALLVAFFRFGGHRRRQGDALAPRHRGHLVERVDYADTIRFREHRGVFVIEEAPEQALLPGDLYRRARHGSWPNLQYAHTDRGDLITFGTIGVEEGRVVYQLGRMHPVMADTYYALRVA